jgi:hypothetical protein
MLEETALHIAVATPLALTILLPTWRRASRIRTVGIVAAIAAFAAVFIASYGVFCISCQ